ncbi:hypothetical protein GCM10011348_03570 [Marinobacterium nitratireducens]|uniref:Integrase catalytic domain-containing protein n=1 Tax=Marinobacterium nitratireducens TaxID=518897 RepID=A0A918DNA9_9GAMM|nr:hypothetical protein GCM10011348_03570 [Marinobacterium nitratireducens]
MNFYIFRTLTEVREITDKWLVEYNEERHHESLGDLAPCVFLAQHYDRMDSNNCWH